MQGAKECRLRRTNSTPQGEATEGNAADDILLVYRIIKLLYLLLKNDTQPHLYY